MILRSLLAVCAATAWLFAADARGQTGDAASVLESCRAHGLRELRQAGSRVSDLVIDRDRHLAIERHRGRIGSQPVAWIASGRGALVFDETPAIELGFVCLLAAPARALHFHWQPRSDGSALSQCSRRDRSAEALGRCLDTLLMIEEMELTRAAALQFQASREADAAAGDERASGAYREAAQSWRAYRDAECARRGEAAARKACLVDLTRRRARDMDERQ